MLPEQVALTVTAAAISISKRLNDEDLALLAAAFTQLGDTLTTISAARLWAQAIAKANTTDKTPRP